MVSVQSKVTSKGQITLPKQIRKRLAIFPGDRLEFSLENSHTVSLRKKRTPGSSAGCGKRFLSQGPKPVNVEQMDSGISKYMVNKFNRSERNVT
jgi:antitoxin PrlF